MKSIVKLKPGHKWFAAESLEPVDGWFGPCDTLEKAVLEAFASGFIEDNIIYAVQGVKVIGDGTDAEEEASVWEWEINTLEYLRIQFLVQVGGRRTERKKG